MSICINTHLAINQHLVGTLVNLNPGNARVKLLLTKEMTADDRGLIHGGFIFGLADYVAMAAVNDPNVVLASSSCNFLKPSMTGDVLIGEAKILEEKGKRRVVDVVVWKEAAIGEPRVNVFTGTFCCVVLDKHVLDY